jgi:hypothetical protein
MAMSVKGIHQVPGMHRDAVTRLIAPKQAPVLRPAQFDFSGGLNTARVHGTVTTRNALVRN